MKEMKRIISLVLCLVMIVGLVPMSVFAATGDTHYLMFATDRHKNTSIIGNIINNMESTIGENKLEYLALGGDMVGSGESHPAYNSSTVLKEVTGATSSLSATNVDIVAGIHDMNVTDDAGIVLAYQGGGAQIYEGDDYYVYGVEEYCISEDSNESNWSAQAQAFVDWANGSGIDKSKVIFVSSHYPLHAKRNDNDGAYYWHQALNTVATGSASGDATVERNIVFFHGHNHTVDGNEYVYNVGDTMSIQNGSSTVSETIYYTYATAGYLNQNSKASDGTYNSNKIAIKYFNGSTVYTTTDYITVSSDAELTALNTLIEGLYTPTSTGTYYSTAMQNAYNTVIAQDAVSDNTQALVFMSDGGPTYYTYLNDSGTGTTVNSSTGATFVGWFDVDDNDTTDETDDTATPNSSFKTEYYSYLLKQAGYPVYTVGLGLSTNDTGPSSYTGLTSGAHEAITSYILSNMATNSSHFYNIADSDAVDNMGNIFSGIAASIKEAARDVVVEDMIGNNYSVNFSLPTGLTSQETDGLEDFYIQVVDYVLDSTTHERTGVYTVLENFTFDGENGKLISHTVNGEACGDSYTHVTFTDGVVTAIDGTYFDYKSDSTGEYLTWTSEKLTANELALQYFAYLDDSAGTDVENQIPAGTYYTNEYATLTYTNVNNKVVQQEFPVPQMTWNGAQVSYVFYLVNEAGLPVNRAGRVVPFAEAVYVTDVYTKAVVWNKMEQTAGLEAKYLADDLVPEVYALYDDDASYNIHVYEKETVVNLNNHFVIGGDVTDDYNTVTNSWKNPKTTYVFNAKSDTTKYNETGTYVKNDGDDTLNETGLSYFCKSALLEGATYTTSVENDVTVYTVDSVGKGYQAVSGETQATVERIEAAGGSTTGGTIIGDYIYYVDENGGVYTIVTKTDGTEVNKGFDFHNTTVAFAVVWKPELVPDTVVIDYGLDVVINVTTNDNMASGVVGVRTTAPNATTEGTYERDKDITIPANPTSSLTPDVLPQKAAPFSWRGLSFEMR